MCGLLCLLAVLQKSAAACQEAGVAPAPPFDSLQEEHLKVIKTQNKASAEGIKSSIPLAGCRGAWPKVLRSED